VFVAYLRTGPGCWIACGMSKHWRDSPHVGWGAPGWGEGGIGNTLTLGVRLALPGRTLLTATINTTVCLYRKIAK